MLNISNVSVSFQGTPLFTQLSFMLKEGDRVGLIGKNGAGKSTLLKVIAKQMQPDSGVIATDKDTRIGFLKQDIDFDKGKTVLEQAYQAFSEIQHLEQQMERINAQLANEDDYHSQQYHDLIEQLSDITHRYDILGGYRYKGETEKILLGLGFSKEDFNKPTELFSGGWRMRIELAKLLLQNNDVLLLDEPTNHLDIESIIWLEQFLITYKGVVLIVSHDKMFLDNVTNRTIEISSGRIYDYNKPYSQFIKFREELLQQQLSEKKNQDKKIQQTEQLIERFRAKANKASMAQSLIKKLDKIERIEVDKQDVSVMNIRFPMAIIPGRVVLEINDASKRFADKQVLEHINLRLERGKKVAFVGQNGQGKTTLAKMIVGEHHFDGEIKLGHNVKLGYFAQNQADYLDGEQTIYDTMYQVATDENRTEIRDILGAFLFRGDDVDKKVKVLSGGERNRLALAKLLLSSFNVLIMDEPTNHLDIPSKNVLKMALKRFEGTLIIVSHDRDFLQGLTDTVYEFKDKSVKTFLGDIDFYLEQRSASSFREIERRSEMITAPQSVAEEKNDYLRQKELKSIKNQINKIERTIEQIEQEIKQMDEMLSVDYQKYSSDDSFFKIYQMKKQDLEQQMQKWEEYHHRLAQ